MRTQLVLAAIARAAAARIAAEAQGSRAGPRRDGGRGLARVASLSGW